MADRVVANPESVRRDLPRCSRVVADEVAGEEERSGDMITLERGEDRRNCVAVRPCIKSQRHYVPRVGMRVQSCPASRPVIGGAPARAVLDPVPAGLSAMWIVSLAVRWKFSIQPGWVSLSPSQQTPERCQAPRAAPTGSERRE